MAKNKQDARNRIIAAATEILNEASDIDKVTVRQISERANVGIGTINYHFNSKDNLLSIAVGNIMANMIEKFMKPQKDLNLEPAEKLKTMLKGVCKIGVSNNKLIQFMLTQSILNGDMQTPLYLVPFLKEIYGNEKTEIEMRVIALQILQPIQIAGISPSELLMYSGVDFYNDEERNKFIDMLIDNVIGDKGGNQK